MIKMTPVHSSNVAAIGYDKDKKEMHVQFKSGGRTYVYLAVEPADHEAFVNASSHGKHFHQHIRGKFEFS